MPPNAHLHQPLLSRACPRASGHAGPGLPGNVLPGRGSLWEGGLGGRGRERQGPSSAPCLPHPTQGEDSRLEARATLNSQCGLGQVAALSGPGVPLLHDGAGRGGVGELPRAPSPLTTLHWGFWFPGEGRYVEGCGHKRAP